MILRIMGEGQYRVPDAETDGIQRLDAALETAVDTDDDALFRQALVGLLERVRAVGERLPDDDLHPSDAILPGPDAHVEEVRALLGSSESGIIPGAPTG